ncbi:hypothetical protein [Arthrobacter woluwensis]|uniref:hypothetical protein n=1 Tax=Arthrobacter woluwensis TaxID=156980 RepID=UPI0011147348|nr:hypothetical protein [Arthrobacter woluwensis]
MTSPNEGISGVYREMAIAWSHLSSEPRKANIAFRKHHVFAKAIRATAEGQQAILDLLNDSSEVVRLLAATDALKFSPDEAIRVLEELEQGSTLYAVDAEYTIRGFRDGTLDLDW